jgi:type VI secretion system protein ImpH
VASTGRREPPPLRELLFERPHQFEFFQAVRLLQVLDRSRVPVGLDGEPASEAVRFRSDVSMRFPTGDIVELRAGTGAGPPELSIGFMGVASPHSFGSLPLHYAQLVRETRAGKNPALGAFLDLFNHRLISLFYRAYERHQCALQFERVERAGTSSFERLLFALMGMADPALRARLPFDDRALLRWTGVLSRAPVTAAELEDLLADYFQVPVKVEQFRAAWCTLADSDQGRLGERGRLGEDLCIGTRVLVAQHRFRLHFGPMGWEAFQELLPGQRGSRSLGILVGLAVGPELEFDARLVLRADQTPECRLGRSAAGLPPQLGWSTWIGRRAEEATEVEAIVYERNTRTRESDQESSEDPRVAREEVEQ